MILEVRPHSRLERRREQLCELRFNVVDTGIGISAEKVDMIFHPFTQVDGSVTRAYGGTGLGLAISKELVEMMGGGLHVASEAGHGSIFSFTSPFRVA